MYKEGYYWLNYNGESRWRIAFCDGNELWFFPGIELFVMESQVVDDYDTIRGPIPLPEE